ncbi:MAG TPA: hypothetical protein VFW44_09115 [Bryobacteraceae bacterium]|nr:hypothetical protein [Bryobacteraceae bacterium]
MAAINAHVMLDVSLMATNRSQVLSIREACSSQAMKTVFVLRLVVKRLELHHMALCQRLAEGADGSHGKVDGKGVRRKPAQERY